MLNIFKSYFEEKDKYAKVEALYKENTEKRRSLYQQCIDKKDVQGLLAVFAIEFAELPFDRPTNQHEKKIFLMCLC